MCIVKFAGRRKRVKLLQREKEKRSCKNHSRIWFLEIIQYFYISEPSNVFDILVRAYIDFLLLFFSILTNFFFTLLIILTQILVLPNLT